MICRLMLLLHASASSAKIATAIFESSSIPLSASHLILRSAAGLGSIVVLQGWVIYTSYIFLDRLPDSGPSKLAAVTHAQTYRAGLECTIEFY
jgi:hypothetical protein